MASIFTFRLSVTGHAPAKFVVVGVLGGGKPHHPKTPNPVGTRPVMDRRKVKMETIFVGERPQLERLRVD